LYEVLGGKKLAVHSSQFLLRDIKVRFPERALVNIFTELSISRVRAQIVIHYS